MAVYLTKDMLSKLNKDKYKSYPYDDDEACGSKDKWQKLMGRQDTRLDKDFICRVCANTASTPLTDKLMHGADYDIMSAIRSITNVNINIDDSLPKYICAMCLETLKVAMSFKKDCENADKKFRQILNPSGDPSLHSYPYSKHDFHLLLHQIKMKRHKIEQKIERDRKAKELKKLKEKKRFKVKEFKCSPCDVTFSDKESLTCHRRERQCMRRACELCGQLVVSIVQHMRHTHKHSAPHKCPTCGKEFPIIARLKNHMLVHTDTFNFFCDLCPYKCKHKYYLVMHMRTHTGEKPYKCAQCAATFVNPSNLNKHKLVHQEKQFKCNLCEKAFRTSTALREHHEAAHLNIKHYCNYCSREFCYKTDLRKHEIKYHNRTKRDFIGGEPTYKQVERMQQKLQEGDRELGVEIEIGREQLEVEQHVTYIHQGKEFLPTQTMYFSDVSGMVQQPQMVQQQVPQQTVQLTMPELILKKDDVKIYEGSQGIGYF